MTRKKNGSDSDRILVSRKDLKCTFHLRLRFFKNLFNCHRWKRGQVQIYLLLGKKQWILGLSKESDMCFVLDMINFWKKSFQWLVDRFWAFIFFCCVCVLTPLNNFFVTKTCEFLLKICVFTSGTSSWNNSNVFSPFTNVTFVEELTKKKYLTKNEI